MQGNRASFPSEGDVSYDLSSCGKNLVYIGDLQRGWPFETPLCSSKSGNLHSYEGHLRDLNEAWQDKTDTSGGEVGDQVFLSSFHRDIGIPINFQEESASSPFEALNSTSLSRCQGM